MGGNFGFKLWGFLLFSFFFFLFSFFFFVCLFCLTNCFYMIGMMDDSALC